MCKTIRRNNILNNKTKACVWSVNSPLSNWKLSYWRQMYLNCWMEATINFYSSGFIYWHLLNKCTWAVGKQDKCNGNWHFVDKTEALFLRTMSELVRNEVYLAIYKKKSAAKRLTTGSVEHCNTKCHVMHQRKHILYFFCLKRVFAIPTVFCFTSHVGRWGTGKVWHERRPHLQDARLEIKWQRSVAVIWNAIAA